ncbi:MAG: hypothetical protein AAF320_06515, partial [Myxococcota bacterium]
MHVSSEEGREAQLRRRLVSICKAWGFDPALQTSFVLLGITVCVLPHMVWLSPGMPFSQSMANLHAVAFVVYFTILLSGQTVQETKFPLLCLLWLTALVIAWPCCSTYMLFVSPAKQPCLVWWVSCLAIGVLQLGVAAALVVWLLGCSTGVALYWAAGGIVSFGAASLYVPVWAGVMGAFLLIACNSLRGMHKAAAYTQGGLALVLCGFLEHEMRKPLSSCLQKAVSLQGDLPKLVLAYRKAAAAGLVS